jgi:3-oxoacyl-[acyl-carrier protein] reductase
VKRVLVTGSSRGIGKAIALELARQGWSVAVHGSRYSEELKETAEELGASLAGSYSADISKKQGVEELFQAASSEGPIDALVNNAGVYRQQNLLTEDDNQFEEVLEVTVSTNFLAPLRLSRLVAAQFNQGGKILNVASRVGFRGEAGASIYSASKAALINITRALAVELSKNGIGVFGIAPGWVDTAMAREGMEDRLPGILDGIPLGRMGSPQDCANAAAFLLKEESAYLSGVVIDINGASYFH